MTLRTLSVAVAALGLAAPALADDWSGRVGGYVGVSGGYAFGASAGDVHTVDTHDRTYSTDLEVDNGWQATVDGGVIVPLGLEWLRLRVGAEAGHTSADLDDNFDGFSGDRVRGDLSFWRVGPAAAVDIRIRDTPWSFSAGLAVGAAFLNLDTTVRNGPTTRASDEDDTVLYTSGLISANLALGPHAVLTMGLRSIWLVDATVRGTDTVIGSTTYEVEHVLLPTVSAEIGLRFEF